MTRLTRDDAVAFTERIQTDPVFFVREVLGACPWSAQEAILRSVWANKRTAVKACHGPGKTKTASWATLAWLHAFPFSRVVTTAPTWNQVERILWAEINVDHAKATARGVDLGSRIYQTSCEVAPGWYAVGLSTDRPDRFQGHHADRLLVIVDEAFGVGHGIMEAVEGFLTSPGSRLLAIGNPTDPTCHVARAWKRDRAHWEVFTISAFDTPNLTGEAVPADVAASLVSREWVEEKATLWGVDSPLYQVRVLGEFPTQSEDSVISVAVVEAAQARVWEVVDTVDLVESTDKVIACDPARFGDDETVIAKREGNRIRIRHTVHGQDTMTTVGEIVRIYREDETARVVVDEIGIGAGIVDRLKELGIPVQGYNSAETAIEKEEFPNRRSELWFVAAERLADVDLDGDEQLAADLTAPRYRIDSSGRRVVEKKEETKKRLGRSPDRADAVLMTFVPPARPTIGLSFFGGGS